MKKLNYLGIGPKIGGIGIPYLALTIFLSLKYKPFFSISATSQTFLVYFGLILVFAGLILYISTLPLLLRGLKEMKMITNGAFGLCRNPLYVSFILFLLPGIAFALNSWLVLTAAVLSYILFKINIKSEYLEMENFFGDEYRRYSSRTPEFFPLPFKKWFSK